MLIYILEQLDEPIIELVDFINIAIKTLRRLYLLVKTPYRVRRVLLTNSYLG